MSEPLRLGIDVDGVLADFNEKFSRTIHDLTGKRLTYGPDGPCVWSYHIEGGVTREEDAMVWRYIEEQRDWWLLMSPEADAVRGMRDLADETRKGRIEPFFITSRPGATAKAQTLEWLRHTANLSFPHVIVTRSHRHKARVVRALEVDAFIDDKWENAKEVAMATAVDSYIRDRAYNQRTNDFGTALIRTPSFDTFMDLMKERI